MSNGGICNFFYYRRSGKGDGKKNKMRKIVQMFDEGKLEYQKEKDLIF